MIETIRVAHKNVGIDFRYLLSQKKTYMILAIILIFGWWHTADFLRASMETGIRTAPWIFQEYFGSPTMLMLYGFLTVMVFADIPYHNSMSQMIGIRTGRRNWIISQMIYTVELAFFYTLAFVLSSFLFLLPRIYFTTGWGEFLTRVADGRVEGLSRVTSQMVENYSPVRAVLITFLCVWGVSVFMGMLIFVLRMFISHSVAIAVAGFLAFFSYFVISMGAMVFGNFLYKVSPLNWLCLYYIDPAFGYSGVPGLRYVGVFLTVGSLIFAAAGCMWYLRGHEIR